MASNFGKSKRKTFSDVAGEILSSHVFPFFTAAVVLTCYYLGWDMVTIYYLGLVTAIMVLVLGDLTPLVSHLLFFNVMISMKHSPSQTAFAPESDYFSRTENLILIGVILGLVIIAIVLRLAVVCKDKKFKPTPVFFGLCALGGAFLLSGLGKHGYSAFDFLYSAIMAAVYVVLFALISSNVRLCGENYKKICFGFLALSLLLVIELFAIYVNNRGSMLNAQGEIIKEKIALGWGIWNTVGMLLVLCIPATLMLASKYRWGFGFIVYATLLFVAVFLTTSRQAMVAALVVYPLSLVLLLIKSKQRSVNAITVAGIVSIGFIVLIAEWDVVIRLLGRIFENIFDGEGNLYGNGRINLIKVAMRFFTDYPVFGAGFFLNFHDIDFTGLNFVPEMACNTFAELFAACGAVGVIAYSVHRVQTIVGFAKRPSFDKAYCALIICGILITSLFDNHMFYILPNLIYSSVLPFALGEAAEGRAVFFSKNKISLKEPGEE